LFDKAWQFTKKCLGGLVIGDRFREDPLIVDKFC
jgi:hypothetical protein